MYDATALISLIMCLSWSKGRCENTWKIMSFFGFFQEKSTSKVEPGFESTSRLKTASGLERGYR
jgi:hypothetical protein